MKSYQIVVDSAVSRIATVKVPHVRGAFKEQENLEVDFEPHWKPVDRSRSAA